MDDHRRVPAPPSGEADVGHLFGVLGDFNLELLQGAFHREVVHLIQAEVLDLATPTTPSAGDRG
jgi:hypothetical protein